MSETEMVVSGKSFADFLDEFNPETMITATDAETTIDRARLLLIQNLNEEQRWAVMGEVVAVRRGAILKAVDKLAGKPARNKLCGELGISERAARNYIRLFENQGLPFIKNLPATKAYGVLPLLNEEGVTFEKDKIIFQVEGAEDITLTLDEAAGMTNAQLTSVIKKNRALQTKVNHFDDTLAEAERQRKESELDLRDEIKKLETRLSALTDDDPETVIDARLKDFQDQTLLCARQAKSLKDLQEDMSFEQLSTFRAHAGLALDILKAARWGDAVISET